MGRDSNILTVWGNKDSMNLNSMILTNIQASTYFKTNLYELKTYHAVIDEIYYRVNHLEPWEKGSRKTHGLTGMCGGVRGVGGGGIVSTAFCLLYKLYTLRLTRKQVVGLMTHSDSPYIRALGFMYVRYTQNPEDLWYWYEEYLDDEEEVDVKAGGGVIMTIGQMLRLWLTKLEWFDTLFPRIPVPIQKQIMDSLRYKYGNRVDTNAFYEYGGGKAAARAVAGPSKASAEASEAAVHSREDSRSNEESRRLRSPSRSRSRSRRRDRSRSRSRSRSRRRRSSSRSRSRSRDRHRHHKKSKRSSRSRSRSSSRHRRHHDKKRHEARSSRRSRSRSRSE